MYCSSGRNGSRLISILFATAVGVCAQVSSPYTCTTNAAAPPVVRAEGLAERVGEIVLRCAGTHPSSGISGNVQVFLNTSITSKLLGDPQAPALSEALLLVDDPSSPTLNTNAFLGRITTSSSVTFAGVPLARAGVTNSSRTLRITNIRANASSLGSGSLVPNSINAVVSITPSSAAVSNPQQAVAFPARGVKASVSPQTFFQCVDSNRQTGQAPTNPIDVRFAEEFATAFKIAMEPNQNPSQPGIIYASESGFVNPALGNATGVATQGTRLTAALTNVPPGVTLYASVSPRNGNSGLSAQMVSDDQGGAGGSVISGSSLFDGVYAQIAVTGGSGRVTWEVTAANPSQIESLIFRIVVSYQGGQPAPGTASVNGRLAPVTTVSSASATAPVPRFVDTSTSQPAFSVSAACPASLSVSPGSLSFTHVAGASGPAPRTLSAAVSSGASNVTAAASTANGGNWLTVSPASAVTPANLQVTVNATGLSAGTYTGSVTVSASGAQNSPQTIPVSLTVTTPSIAVNPASLSFDHQIGSGAPADQTLTVSSTPQGVSYTTAAISAGGWLSVTPAGGTTTGSLLVGVMVSGLTPGVYNGTIRITAAGANPITVPVTLTIAQSTLSVSPASLAFTHQTGSTGPAPRIVNVSSTRPGVNFSAAAASNGGWLSVTPASGVTTSTLSVAVNTTGLAAGDYNGSITLTAAGVTPVNVPVTLSITQVTLTAAPASLVFNHQTGAAGPAAQTISLSSNPANVTYATAASSTGGWLSVAPAGGSTPGTLTVTVNVAGLAAGTHNGSISITSAGVNPVSIPVSLTIGQSTLSVSPTSLTFTHQTGSTGPAAQTLSVTSNPSGVNYSLTANSNGGWLSVTPSSGATASTLTVSVSRAGLTAGDYNGSITLTAAGVTPVNVPVRLSITQATLTATPMSLSFHHQTGAAAPVAQTINLTSNPANLTFTAVASSTGGWLSVAPGGGSSPATLNVSVNIAGLSPGTHNGAISVTGTGVSPLNIPVTLSIGQSSLSINPTSLTFSYQSGSSLPQNQTLNITSVPIGAGYSAAAASNGGWLSVSPVNGVAPSAVAVSVNPAGLAAGDYQASITLTAAGVTPVNVPVTLSITQISLTAAPVSLSFNHQAGAAAPAAQTISLSSSSPGATFTAVAISNGGWLTVTPASGSTPAVLTAGVNVSGLAAGALNGSIRITAPGLNPINVPVSLTITQTSLTANPAVLSFDYVAGATPPAAQNLRVTSNLNGLSFTASSNSPWLAINPNNGTIPATLTATVNVTGLAAGSYQGSITISAAGETVSVGVSLTIGRVTLFSQQTSLAFSYLAGTPQLPPQNLNINSNPPGISYTVTASSTAGWLSVSPSNGVAPGVVSVTVNPAGLAAGSHSGSINIAGSGATLTVPVTLTITQLTLSASPVSVSFVHQSGSAAPAPQMLSITSNHANTRITAASNSAGDWLSATPVTGVTPATLAVSINPARLVAGTYNGSIVISSQELPTASLTVPVSLTVGQIGLTSTPSSLIFTHSADGPAPAAQNLSIASTPTGTSITVNASSSGNWLTVTQREGSTPATIAVAVNPSGLNAGTYNGSVTITIAGSQAQLTVPVSLTVGQTMLTAQPAGLTFQQLAGSGMPGTQMLNVISIPDAVTVVASANSSGGWLSVSPAGAPLTTPATLAVSASASGLPAGTYQGSITLTANGSGTALIVPVSLTVTTSTLEVTPSALSITQGGDVPPIDIRSNPPGLRYTAVVIGGDWLSVVPTEGVTPAAIEVSTKVAGLTPGTYRSEIIISAAGAPAQTVPVQLTIPARPIITALSRKSVASGEGGFFLTIAGSGFVSGSQVMWGQTPIGGRLMGDTEIIAEIPTAALSAPGAIEIRVVNPDGTTSNVEMFAIRLAPASVRIEISGGRGAGEQPRVDVVLAAPLNFDISGFLVLKNDQSDPAIQFTTGGKEVPFRIAANSTRSDLAGRGTAFQTGTVAGSISVTARLEANGQELSPDPAPTETIVIEPAAPLIRRVEWQNTAQGFNILVTGFTTARSVSDIAVEFSGSNLQTSSQPAGVAERFRSWYSGEESARFGGQFTLTLPYDVSGDRNAIRSVSITLSNSHGSSGAVAVDMRAP